MNKLQIFNSPKFGEIRTVDVDGKIYFVAKDAAMALGYSNTKDAILRHCKGIVKRDLLTKGGKQLMNVIPEGDIYRLVTHSELPAAEEFESWIFDEVLPSIRKTGTYSTNPTPKEDTQSARAKAMLLNAKTRAAQTWLKIAAAVNIPEYKQIANTYAANTLADKEVLELPKAERKTYSATDIGKMFSVSANKIGKIANMNHLKTEEYGKFFYDKSRYSVKEVETWRYYENVIPVFAKLLEVEQQAKPKQLAVVQGGAVQ